MDLDKNINCLELYDDNLTMGNSINSFAEYKMRIKQKVLKPKCECDSLPEVKNKLAALFGESDYTDTLISPQNYVTKYMRYFHSDLLVYNSYSNDYIVPNISGVKRQIFSYLELEKGKINNQSVWAFFIKNKLEIMQKSEPKAFDIMSEFLDVVYTIPNFSSICEGFNMGRSNEKTNDNFLIALYHIKDYFDKRREGRSNLELRDVLAEFLDANIVNGKEKLTQDEVISRAQDWLNKYSSFERFVYIYKLQVFLDSNYEPVTLWPGIYEGVLLPPKEDFLSSIDFLTKAIKDRGRLLL
ncbi:hypothetical protein [Alkalibacillus haloalkaliphilus]|uniref:Uncharacterized protein n=1 Tax=Alkalibacillus haloalkaliphilus TaxID=94136 RepID=A0A511W8Q2_9BACI|nr:hypothetical protein [Alkalibacillus haloalkaliphilus]GEN46728.1 hypothetical protein AHA02nite_25040 [Alkalibacillus haloalkaliphilus]